MEFLITPGGMMFIIGIVTMIFSVYLYFKNPQVKLEKNQALQQMEIDTKADTLAKQVQREKETNNLRFVELNTNIKDALALAQNHIHTVDTKVEALSVTVSSLCNEIIKLSTIINERMPKK